MVDSIMFLNPVYIECDQATRTPLPSDFSTNGAMT